MIHIVSFSTGLSSALTAIRVLNAFDRDSVRLVFMDTLFEDEDNYRFMRDFEQKFDVEIIKLCEGMTPVDVFVKERIIPSNRIAPCTFRLKIDVFKKYLKSLEKPITIHIGYDFTELHRCEATRRNYESLGYYVDFPLLWKPYETRKYAQVFREDYGIEPPRMYAMGYTHANCGGRCVKQGQGDWIRTLINFPERFNEMEEFEQSMRKLSDTHAQYALLRHQTPEGKKPITLRELREKFERNQLPSIFDLDSQSSCVVCGIGDLFQKEEQ